MLYPYMKLGDGTEISHSQIIEEADGQTVEVHFERPTSKGFDTARCRLPGYEWVMKEGFTREEMDLFEQFLHSNAHLLFKYAASGGLGIA